MQKVKMDPKSINDMMKKAKRRSTWKIVIITIAITPVIFILLFTLSQMRVNQLANQTIDDLRKFNSISGPNIHFSHQTAQYGIWGGEVSIQTYKIVRGQPVIWQPIERSFNIWGHFSSDVGLYGPIRLKKMGSSRESFLQNPPYNAYTGEREMLFYHPEIKFNAVHQDLNKLNRLNEENGVEVALSFDRPYRLQEVQKMVPENTHIAWWWVDTLDPETLQLLQEKREALLADSPFVFGFDADDEYGYDHKKGIDVFIEHLAYLALHKGEWQWEAQQVYQAIVGKNQKLEKKDVRIIGAVVTGTPQTLQSLADQKFVRASSFGAIVDVKPF